MKLYIYIFSILLIVLSSCQEPNKATQTNNRASDPGPPVRTITKDVPKMTINTNRAKKNIEIFEDATAFKDQQKILQKDDHIGNLRIIGDRDSIESVTKGVTLKKLNTYLLDDKVNRYKMRPLKKNIATNDSGDKYILLDNNSYSLNIDPESGSYENLKIKRQGIGVISTKGYPLRVGDKITVLKNYFPEEFKDTRSIKLQKEDVQSTRISLAKFIGEKSDVFLYVNHRDDVITEIGTWEQY